MDEQPVAFATISRSPNSWDSSFRYGVSPQPAQAPGNSNSGSRNCAPRTVPKSTLDRSLTGSDSKNAMFSRSAGTIGVWSARLIALRDGSIGDWIGDASTHSAHPVQSSTYTCSVYRVSGSPRASRGADGNAAGAPSSRGPS